MRGRSNDLEDTDAGHPPSPLRGYGATSAKQVFLLPVYDEYLVAYRDREAVPHGPSVIASGSGHRVNFQHALVIAGQVAGTWRTTRKTGAVVIAAVPQRRLTRPERHALGEAVHRYERFLGAPTELSIR